MRKPRLYKWNLNNNTEGLLVFAQAIEELLFHHTLDSFKAPALNTHLNILELRFLAFEVLNRKVKPGALIPILDELENRIKNDPVIEDRKQLFLGYHSKLNTSKKDPEEFYSTADALLSEIDNNYWNDLKRKIVDSIQISHEKKKIISLASIFATEIELHGFDKHFLYFMAFNFFFNGNTPPKRIDHANCIQDFLAIFDGDSFDWFVIFRGCSSFNLFKDQAQFYKFEVLDKLSRDFECGHHNTNYFDQNDQFPLFLVFDKIKAKDRFQARKSCNQKIESFSDICKFHNHDTDLSWQSFCLARKITDINFIQVKPPPAPIIRGMAPRIMSKENISRTIDIMKGHYFDRHSIFLFKKAFDYHRSASETVASENQLVSLWAALEGFLPPPKEDEGLSRINQLLNSILPALSLSYVEKIFRYTSVCLLHAGNNIKDFINDFDNSNDFFKNTLILLTSKELEELRVCLYKSLTNHPLLRYRCHWCHENFKSNKSIRKAVTSHRERLTWHIQRIYITRNQIVHSAQNLPYIDALIENLHSYFDILLDSVMKVGTNSKTKMNIHTSLKVLEINEKLYLDELEGEKKIYCQIGNYKELLFGRQNPMNPFTIN
ncbi:hypothetical protein SAMN06295888_11674 [Desulfonatronum zhilinae]|nr:hypothetical protein SAMN06295888_11674 [Desulfonatronum zhilinae]